MLSNPFYEARITLVSKFDKDVTRKENYRPIVLMNTVSGILDKLIIHLGLKI